MKSFRELADQAAELRRARRAQPSVNAKTERNAEIVWMHGMGVPVSHIARVHNLTVVRVRDIIKRAARRS
jgi:Mor family transcriptional regulator